MKNLYRRSWVAELCESLSATAVSLSLPELRLTFAQGSVELLTGYTSDELVLDAELWRTLVVPEDREPLREALERATRVGHGIVSARLTHRSGHEVRVQARVSVVHDARLAAPRLDALLWRDSPAPVTQLLEELPDPVVVVDRDGVILATNSRIAVLGYLPGELRGKPFEQLVPLRHRDSAARRGPFVALARDGSEVPVDVSLGPLTGSDAIAAVIRDLRPLHQLERLSRDADRRFRQTFEQVAVGLAHVGLDGRILAVNQKLLEITGFTEPELIGRQASEFGQPPEAPGQLPDLAGRFQGATSAWVREKQLRRRDGRLAWVRLTTSVARDELGRPEYFVNVVEDIEALRGAEESLRQTQKFEALGRLAGGIAHDFNNLLTVICSYAEGLAAGLEPGSEQHADAEEIRATGERAAALTQQLLDFSRQRPLAPQAVVLAECCDSLERLLRPLLGPGVQLTWLVQPETPACLANRSQLEQVLVNLAINARDAMSGSGRLTVRAGPVELAADNALGLPPGTFVRLEVSDSGEGIPPEVLPHIFEPFFTTKPVGRGTGLGLATVHSIVKQWGGALVVESRRGEGSTFSIHVPATSALQPLASAPVALEAGRARGQRLLVVEDELDVRKVVQAVLTRAGYAVTVVANGAEALFLLQQRGLVFDGLITDLDMPLLDGAELLARVATLPAPPRQMIISASSVAGPPGVRCLDKPFTQSALLAAVDALFEKEKAP